MYMNMCMYMNMSNAMTWYMCHVYCLNRYFDGPCKDSWLCSFPCLLDQANVYLLASIVSLNYALQPIQLILKPFYNNSVTILWYFAGIFDCLLSNEI